MKTTNKRSTFFGFAVTAMMLAASMVMGCKQPSVTVNSYPVSFSAIGGTVTASVDGKEIKNGDLIGVGKEVTFTAHPQSGMQVSRWTGIDKSEGRRFGNRRMHGNYAYGYLCATRTRKAYGKH